MINIGHEYLTDASLGASVECVYPVGLKILMVDVCMRIYKIFHDRENAQIWAKE